MLLFIQLNGATSFLDLSPLYGSDQITSDSLREFAGGRLRWECRGNRIMMPTSQKSGFCDARTPTDICFETGLFLHFLLKFSEKLGNLN